MVKRGGIATSRLCRLHRASPTGVASHRTSTPTQVGVGTSGRGGDRGAGGVIGQESGVGSRGSAVTSEGGRREVPIESSILGAVGTEASHYRCIGGFAPVITPLAPLMLRGEGGRGGIGMARGGGATKQAGCRPCGCVRGGALAGSAAGLSGMVSPSSRCTSKRIRGAVPDFGRA